MRLSSRVVISITTFLGMLSIDPGTVSVAATIPDNGQQPAKDVGKAAPRPKPTTQSSARDDSIEYLLVTAPRISALTDGTGSYVVSAVTTTKTLMRPQDVPQSISVISTQQMRDQNMTTVDDALRQATGVSVNPYGDGTAGYAVRGFSPQPQYDGIPAQSGLAMSQQFDLAIYDRVETLRGPDGLLQGANAAAGSINFVLKRPTSKPAGSASFSQGSWSNSHASLDVGGPIAHSRYVSARLIFAGTDRDFFYRNGHDIRWNLYGVTDIRPTLSDTITLSVATQSNETRRFMGLPRNANGSDPGFPRATWIGPQWNLAHAPMTEWHGAWEHLFQTGWRSVASARYRNTDNVLQYGYVDNWNNTRKTGNVTLLNTHLPSVSDGVDTYLTGPIHLLGQKNVFMIGGNIDHFREDGGGQVLSSQKNPALRGLSIAQIDTISPTLLPTLKNRTVYDTRQWGVYGQAQIKPVSALTILLGGRVSGYRSRQQALGPVAGARRTTLDQNGILTPYAGVVLHLLPQIALYASYTSTFQAQSAWDTDGSQLSPVRGPQIEGGVKGDFFHRKLSVTLAGYSITLENEALFNDKVGMICGPSKTLNCYVAAGRTRSIGAEAEILGRVTPGWDISASYTYNDNYIADDGTPADKGLAYASNAPRHLAKMWTRYRFQPYPGAKNNIWSIGGGLIAQSSTFGNSRSVTQPGYVVGSIQAGYQWRPTLGATLTLDNVSNTRYFQRLGNTRFYNYYGTPRSITGTIRSNF